MALGTLLQGLLVVDIPSLLDHHVPVGLYWASPESKGRRWWPPFPLVEVVPSVVEGLEQLPRVPRWGPSAPEYQGSVSTVVATPLWPGYSFLLGGSCLFIGWQLWKRHWTHSKVIPMSSTNRTFLTFWTNQVYRPARAQLGNYHKGCRSPSRCQLSVGSPTEVPEEDTLPKQEVQCLGSLNLTGLITLLTQPGMLLDYFACLVKYLVMGLDPPVEGLSLGHRPRGCNLLGAFHVFQTQHSKE